ncbi:DnaT-like ssDNA-binding protein [Massilia sp. METH4]|uniref:DnaT-like ssDNA-binding protein n=1 Tax=Massilia sp. METH4 TaxID=3123041 RepID=UPI0030CB6092
MPLIVETGAGLPDAESYASVSEADAYHAARGSNAQWAALAVERREQLLREATEYMACYGSSLSGRRRFAAQALDWPREGAMAHGFDVPPETVPPSIKRACAVLAMKAATGSLRPAAGQVKKRQKVGPLEVEYQDSSTAGALHPAADALVSPYFDDLAGNPFMARLERN